MTLEKVLEQFGLNNKKAKVYLICLELGLSTVQNIAKRSEIKRPTVYDILEDLIEKGLVSQVAKGKKRYFLAEDPEKLKLILKEKEGLLEEVLPQLKSIYNLPTKKPKIRFYEGVEGIKTIWEETLRSKNKEILGIAPPRDVYELLGIDFIKWYVHSRAKLGIKTKTIRIKSKEEREKYFMKHKEELREMRYAPESIVIPCTIIIYNDKVGIISSKKERFGFVIESQEFSQTMKIFFEMLWRVSSKK